MTGIRVGLLGYGLAGSVFHAPLIDAEPALELAAVVSSRGDDIAKDWPGVAILPDVEAMLSLPDIDLVVVATPNEWHCPHARLALEAGKHVVIDKPFALDVEEADELIALAGRAGRLLSVFHNRRFDSGFLTLRRALDDGRLGEVFLYEGRYDRFRPAIKQGWRERPARGSGLLADLGSHLVDQALALFGLPEGVSADVVIQRREAVVEDYFDVTLHYGRRRAILRASTLARLPGPSHAVHGDRGSLLIHGLDPQEAALKAGGRPGGADWGAPGAGQHALIDDGGGPHALPLAAGDYPAFYRAVARAITEGAPPPVAASEARDVLAVLEAARTSVARGGLVTTV